MRYLLSAPSQIKATIQLPASKSISNRALIIHALSKGDDVLSNLSDCDDTQVMIKALTEGNEVIDILAAGTAMRFLTAYLSSTPGIHTITGTERMQQRPIQILVNALRELGCGSNCYFGQQALRFFESDFYPFLLTGMDGDRLITNRGKGDGGVLRNFQCKLPFFSGGGFPFLPFYSDIDSRDGN